MKSGGSIVGGEARERYPSRGSGEQGSVAAVHHPLPAFDATNDAVLHGLIGAGPVVLDSFLAVEKHRNLTIRIALRSKIERRQGIPVTHRLDRPTATRTAKTPTPIKVREPPD